MKKRWMMVMMGLVMAVGCVGLVGCDKEKFVSKSNPSHIIDGKDYARMSPSERSGFDPLVAKQIGDATPVLAPLVAAVPYGTAVVSLLSGLAIAYKKYRPVIEDLKKDSVALREVVRGVEGAEKTTELKDALSKSTSDETKLRITAAKLVNVKTTKSAA